VHVRLRLFASLREAAGRESVDLDLPTGASAEDAWRALVSAYPALGPRRSSLAAAVNRGYAPFDAPLAEGDEIAFIPPVCGG
jgi:molybdopterin converting factor subunit 1